MTLIIGAGRVITVPLLVCTSCMYTYSVPCGWFGVCCLSPPLGCSACVYIWQLMYCSCVSFVHLVGGSQLPTSTACVVPNYSCACMYLCACALARIHFGLHMFPTPTVVRWFGSGLVWFLLSFYVCTYMRCVYIYIYISQYICIVTVTPYVYIVSVTPHVYLHVCISLGTFS